MSNPVMYRVDGGITISAVDAGAGGALKYW